MLLQNLRDVGLERDEVRRVFGVPADRNGAGDMAVDESEWSAEKIDAGGNQRRADAVVVEDERLDEIVRVALVIRGVHDPVAARGGDDVLQLLVLALDLTEDRVERVLERPVDLVALGGLELVKVAVNPLPGPLAAIPVPAAKILDDLFAREHGLGDFVQHKA